MDAARFNTLRHSLTATGTRRGLGRVLAGLALGGALAPLLALDDGEAKKGKGKKGKRKNNNSPPPMEPPMDPPLEPGTPPMEPPPKKRRRRRRREGDWFRP